jgi:cephalosporin hydroxylase
MKSALRVIGGATLVTLIALLALFTLDVLKPLRIRWTDKLVTANPQAVTDAFAILFHSRDLETFNGLRWFGVPIQKSPMDLLIYQEMLFELKPDVVVEAGTFKGGSALFVAQMMDRLGRGRIITIDIEKYPDLPQHPRITYLLGSSTAPEIVASVKALIKPGETVMVLLDSLHTKEHVLDELRLYHALVTPGFYVVVEDTHLNGHPILPKSGPGPMEAVDDFLKENQDFAIDPTREKLMHTFNPRGYLKRKQ